jgi:hypothetical protein
MPRIRPGVPGKPLFWLLSAAAVVLVLVLALPFFVERLILPPLLNRTGFADQRLMVSRFGINGCTIHIAGRPGGPPLLTSGNAHLQWTLPGLLQRRLDGITFDGLLLDPGRLFGRKNSSQSSPAAFRPSPEGIGLPLVVEQVRIVNSFLILTGEQGRNIIPVSLSAHRQDPQDSNDRDVLHYRIVLVAAGQEMKADCVYDHRKGSFAGRLEGVVNLASLAAAVPFFFSSPGQMTGTADIAVRFTAGTAPFVLDRIDGEVRLRDFHWRSPRMPLEIISREEAGMIFAGGGAMYRIHVAGLAAVAPLQAEVAAEGGISLAENRIGWHGDLVVSPVVGQQVGRFFIDEAAPVLLQHEGAISDGRVKGKLTAGAQGDQRQGYAGRYKEGLFRAADLEAEVDFELGPSGVENALTAELSLHGSDIAGELPGGVLVLPGVAIRASVQPARENAGNGLDMKGRLSVADGRLDLPAPDMHFLGIHLSLPFFLSGRQAGEVGDVRIDDIFLRQVRVGGLTGTVQQHRLEYLLSGELRTPVLPENPIRLAARARMPRDQVPFIELSTSVEQAGFDVAHLAPFHSGLKKVSGTGMLDLAGSLAVDKCGLNGGLTVNLRDGNFDIPEAEITMHDTAFTINLPALPRLESAPAQKLTFGMLGGKKVVMHDVLLAFQVESPESLFVERMSARWGGGRIFTSGFRLRPDMKDVEVALFCDRLELAQILSQLGLAEAEGEGRMSGRIPLLYSDRAIFVDDGFLFTTPGEKGSLRIRQSDYLATGMPADVPQFSPLHFAGAALGNFEYNWAKLSVDSEEENLLLKLQIDGRPKERLPYRFDAERNLFLRLEKGEAGGIDQPLKLDVNFRVPVNELFRHHSQIMRYILQDK